MILFCLFFLLQNCISVRPTRLRSVDTLGVGNVLTSISGAVLTDNTRVTLFPSPAAQLVVHFLHAMNMNIWSPCTHTTFDQVLFTPLALPLIKCFCTNITFGCFYINYIASNRRSTQLSAQIRQKCERAGNCNGDWCSPQAWEGWNDSHSRLQLLQFRRHGLLKESKLFKK